MEKYTEAYLKYYKSVYMRCYILLNDAHEAEDATQNVFLAAYNKWDDVCKLDNMRAWLLCVARNKCVDIIRKRKRDEIREEIITEREPQINIIEDAREAVKDFPLKQREIFNLVFLEGYHNKEIAEILQVPLSTVKGRIQMCTRELKKVLLMEL